MGLEPITLAGLDLQSNALANSATLPLSRGGIEPPSIAFQATALPLSYPDYGSG